MTPTEWAEVFQAGEIAARYPAKDNPITRALDAMGKKCREIQERHQPEPEPEWRTHEATIYGVPISKITLDKAVEMQKWIAPFDDDQAKYIKRVLARIIEVQGLKDK